MSLNIYLFIFFCKYPRVPVDSKKLCWYPHNGYPTNMNTGTGQRVGYEGVTTRTLSTPLTSLILTKFITKIKFNTNNLQRKII